MGEQPFLQADPTSEAAQLTARGDHAVTRNKERKIISAIRASDSPDRFGVVNCGSEVAVATCCAKRYLNQFRPDTKLERRASERKRKIKTLATTAEVFECLRCGSVQRIRSRSSFALLPIIFPKPPQEFVLATRVLVIEHAGGVDVAVQFSKEDAHW